MKKFIIYFVCVLFCIGVITKAKAQKSETFTTVVDAFKTSLESYETKFFTGFFELKKTGPEILSDSIILLDLENKVFAAFITEFSSFKAFSMEHKGDKPFKYKHKRIKGYSEELAEFEKQFNSIIKDYKDNRLNWTKPELTQKQAKAMIMVYITPVVDKFKKRIEDVQKQIKNL